jgi:hypothetical protein
MHFQIKPFSLEGKEGQRLNTYNISSDIDFQDYVPMTPTTPVEDWHVCRCVREVGFLVAQGVIFSY